MTETTLDWIIGGRPGTSEVRSTVLQTTVYNTLPYFRIRTGMLMSMVPIPSRHSFSIYAETVATV